MLNPISEIQTDPRNGRYTTSYTHDSREARVCKHVFLRGMPCLHSRLSPSLQQAIWKCTITGDKRDGGYGLVK